MIILYMKTFGDEKWSNPLILFWTVFLGMRNEATHDSVLNCFGDENWSNPWIRPNRHPSRHCCCADSWRWCCADSNVLEEFLHLRISLFLYNGGGGRAGDFLVAKGHGYPHQCLSRQRTQRVHANFKYKHYQGLLEKKRKWHYIKMHNVMYWISILASHSLNISLKNDSSLKLMLTIKENDKWLTLEEILYFVTNKFVITCNWIVICN